MTKTKQTYTVQIEATVTIYGQYTVIASSSDKAEELADQAFRDEFKPTENLAAAIDPGFDIDGVDCEITETEEF